MINVSRRQLARFAVDEIQSGSSIDSIAQKLAAALSETKMKKDSELLLADIAHELEERGLVVSAKVTTASPLSADLRHEISSKIKVVTKAQAVSLDEIIDKDVIGGMRIETANHSWDKTTKSFLEELKEKI